MPAPSPATPIRWTRRARPPGAEYRAAGAVLGVAVDYSRPKADFVTGDGSLQGARDWQVGAYAGWSGGGAFVQGYAGYGWLRYRINRAAVIDTIHSRPDGTSVTAGGKAGYLAGFGGLRVGPVVALDYERATINGYTETGDPVLTLNVGRAESGFAARQCRPRAARRLQLGRARRQPLCRGDGGARAAGRRAAPSPMPRRRRRPSSTASACRAGPATRTAG